MELRVIKEDKDIKELCNLAEIIWHEHFPGIITNEQIDYMINKFLSFDVLKQQINEGYHYDGMYIDNKLIGFMIYKDEIEKVFLSKLYVEKNYRGNGYARIAFNHLIKHTKDINKKEIWLTCNKDNKNSIAAYVKMGFKIFDEAVNDIGNNFVMDDYYFNYKIK